MGNYRRPIPTRCWVRFLKAHGCRFVSKHRTSHDKWECPGCFRPIIFRGADKEVPFVHFTNDLETMGVSLEYFWEWVRKNC